MTPNSNKSESSKVRVRRSVVLPVVAVGLLALAPWQAAGLFHRWQAMAQSAPPPSPGPSPPAVPAAADPGSAPIEPPVPTRTAAVASAAGTGPVVQESPDGKYLEELNRRAAELDQREHDLRTWATQVAAAEKLARAQLAELGRMRADVEKMVTQQTVASDEDLGVLVGLYSNMKPTQAASLLGRLEAPTAAAILEKLDIHSAGPALAAMDPTVAVAITEELSRRHAPFRR